MDVTKVVGFDLRITKHFSLHFYDFSTILYGIYKFAVFENKRKRKRTLAFRPLEVCSFSLEVPGGLAEQRRVGRRHFQRGSAPAARGKLGKSERGLSRTSGVLGSRGGGPRRRLHRAGRPAVVELRGGGAPVKEGRQGLVGELRGEVGDRFRGLSRAEEGWGVEFHWSRRPAAVCTAAAAHR